MEVPEWVSAKDTNDFLVALIGLAGVIVGALVTAGTSLLMAWRHGVRDSRAARWIIRSDLREADEAVRSALEYKKWPPGWTNKSWSDSWSMYRPTLALAELDDKQSDKIAKAYLKMALLETGLAAGEREFNENDLRFMREASQAIGVAIKALWEP
jgi:hypothetical protein